MVTAYFLESRSACFLDRRAAAAASWLKRDVRPHSLLDDPPMELRLHFGRLRHRRRAPLSLLSIGLSTRAGAISQLIKNTRVNTLKHKNAPSPARQAGASHTDLIHETRRARSSRREAGVIYFRTKRARAQDE